MTPYLMVSGGLLPLRARPYEATFSVRIPRSNGQVEIVPRSLRAVKNIAEVRKRRAAISVLAQLTRSMKSAGYLS